MAFTTELIHILKDVAGENHVFTKESIGLDYTHDELAGGMSFKPDAVVEVRSADEVSAVLRICSEAGVPVTVRRRGYRQSRRQRACQGRRDPVFEGHEQNYRIQ